MTAIIAALVPPGLPTVSKVQRITSFLSNNTDSFNVCIDVELVNVTDNSGVVLLFLYILKIILTPAPNVAVDVSDNSMITEDCINGNGIELATAYADTVPLVLIDPIGNVPGET
jgi:hypothetical protein